LFQVELSVRGETLSEGTGASKKEAEQEAARLALEKLRIQNSEFGMRD
jgi:ribonuclease-3